ncbi:hypothetical protein C476_12873 [Natrinema limicola JCM 13563]|uniref:Uncharacterized protein n=1 Tax=Natrinema limicola JCM 13563 TaxID=1230457 RepID=M0C760_9EURY|nr:hypothetical protein C476_12873 [Natrinema limicola JCM 13563]
MIPDRTVGTVEMLWLGVARMAVSDLIVRLQAKRAARAMAVTRVRPSVITADRAIFTVTPVEFHV